MRLPELTEMATAKDNTEEFKGYNHNLRNEVGEWYDQKNMTTDYYPVASPRDKRARQIYASNPSITYGGNSYTAGETLAMAYANKRLITLQKFSKGNEDAGCVFVDNGEIGTQQFIEHTYNYKIISITSVVDESTFTDLICINITATLNASPAAIVSGTKGLIKFIGSRGGNLEARAFIVSVSGSTIRAELGIGGTINVARDVAARIGASTNLQYTTRFDSYQTLVNKAGYFDSKTKKSIVPMGSYMCIFPDGVVYESANTDDLVPVYKIAQRIEPTGVLLQTVIEDNESPTGYTDIPDFKDSTANTENYRISDGQVQYYIKNSGMWVAQQTFVKISAAAGTFDDFNEGDALFMKFECEDEMGDGDIGDITAFYGLISYDRQKKQFNEASIKILKKGADNDYIIVNGFVGYTYVGAGSHTCSYYNTDDIAMSFTRRKPDIAYACESQNRIWACSKDGHEIYASALGNPYNFYDYSGLATDSYAVNVGTDGEFTGCVNYMGQPLFFKENALHYISGSYPSNNGTMDGMSYAVTTLTDFKGAEKGSEKSFAIIDNILYYKSAVGIVAYDGANTVVVSDALGKEKYKNAIAGAYKNKYYVSMQDKNDVYHLFVYDTELGTWCKEDNTQVLQFLPVKNELLYIDVRGENVYSVASENIFNYDAYMQEEDFEWECETGNFGYSYPNNKYLSRFQVRMQIADGAKAAIYVQYNSDGAWHRKGEMTGKGVRTHLFPIVPIRCDHMKIKIAGKGDVKVFSIAKIFEEGGDV